MTRGTSAEGLAVPYDDEASLHAFAMALSLGELQVTSKWRQSWSVLRHPFQAYSQLKPRHVSLARIGPRAIPRADLAEVRMDLLSYGDKSRGLVELSWMYDAEADPRLHKFIGGIAANFSHVVLSGGSASLSQTHRDDYQSVVLWPIMQRYQSDDAWRDEQEQLNAALGEHGLEECGFVLDALAFQMGYEDRAHFFARQS